VDLAATNGNTVTSMVYEKNGVHFAYAGGDHNAIDVFRISDDGELTPVERYKLAKEKGPARGIIADRIAGSDYLFVGNKGANTIEVFSIADDGRLNRVFVLEDTDETYLGVIITLHIIHTDQASYLFAGGLEEAPGLSSFEIKANGELVHVHSIKDDAQIHTDGIIGMYSHKVKGQHYLFTGGFQDNGVSSFHVFEDGSFENVNNIADNTTDRYLTGAYPVDGGTLGDNHYDIVGHRHHKYYKRIEFIKEKDFVYHGDGVSVFKVSDKGELVPHFVLKNDEHTRLGGQTRIEILKLDNTRAMVAVGTRDDQSIQLCNLSADGILSPLGSIRTGYPVYYGMSSVKIGEKLFFLTGSVDFGMKKFFSYEVEFPQKNTSPRVLRHIVNIKYKSGATSGEVDAAVQGFIDLKQAIPGIVDFEWGENVSKEGHSKDFTHSFTLTFNNEKDRDAYLTHRAHLDLVEKVGPIMEDVLVMDYWVD
jgi:6-phosphogluconolactonase (cycloisomerase 2 family)